MEIWGITALFKFMKERRIILSPTLSLFIYIYIYIYIYIRGARDIKVIGGGNEHGDPSSNPGRTCLHSHSVNTLKKCMHLTIPPRLWVNDLTFIWQLVSKENYEFKPVKLRLKIDLVSHPARAKGLGKHTYTNTERYRYRYIKSPFTRRIGLLIGFFANDTSWCLAVHCSTTESTKTDVLNSYRAGNIHGRKWNFCPGKGGRCRPFQMCVPDSA